MGKLVKLNIGDYLFNKASSMIRDKKDIIILLLESVKALLMGDIILEENSRGTLLLKIDKMSRLFFIMEDKYFSFGFPFCVEKTFGEAEEIRIYDSSTGIEIDNKVVSILLGLFQEETYNNDSLENLYYELAENKEDDEGTKYNEEILWALFKKLLVFECGYLRYDYDPEHEDGKMHPLHHFDIYFSQGNTFKLGLEDKILSDNFIDVLDLNTECYFLTDYMEKVTHKGKK